MCVIGQVPMSEHNEQSTLVDHALWTYRNNKQGFIRGLFFAVPNGSWLAGNGAYGKEKQIKEGLLPGVSDLLYLQGRGGYTFLAIEMKTEKRRKEKLGGLTIEQMDFIKISNDSGALARVCYGADEAIDLFDFYMSLDINPQLAKVWYFKRGQGILGGNQ